MIRSARRPGGGQGRFVIEARVPLASGPGLRRADEALDITCPSI